MPPFGERTKDISIGLNYYINKYIGIKLNYSYLMPGASIKEISRKNFSVFQGRFQFFLIGYCFHRLIIFPIVIL